MFAGQTALGNFDDFDVDPADLYNRRLTPQSFSFSPAQKLLGPRWAAMCTTPAGIPNETIYKWAKYTMAMLVITRW
jgi:hypothetical protein